MFGRRNVTTLPTDVQMSAEEHKKQWQPTKKLVLMPGTNSAFTERIYKVTTGAKLSRRLTLIARRTEARPTQIGVPAFSQRKIIPAVVVFQMVGRMTAQKWVVSATLKVSEPKEEKSTLEKALVLEIVRARLLQ
jgi:hypothetical protein